MKEATATIHGIHGIKPKGEIREFPVAFSGKHVWRIPGILLDKKHTGLWNPSVDGGLLLLRLVRANLASSSRIVVS
jgi:hypothetical protein